jgi:uncharacterized protein (DUF736 family)
MIIGQFTKNENGFIVGSIASPFGILQDVSFEPITQTGNGPSYRMTVDSGELGAAWTKKSAKGNEYHSVTIRSPFLPAPVNCALLESTRTPGTYNLVWDEPKKDEAA